MRMIVSRRDLVKKQQGSACATVQALIGKGIGGAIQGRLSKLSVARLFQAESDLAATPRLRIKPAAFTEQLKKSKTVVDSH